MRANQHLIGAAEIGDGSPQRIASRCGRPPLRQHRPQQPRQGGPLQGGGQSQQGASLLRFASRQQPRAGQQQVTGGLHDRMLSCFDAARMQRTMAEAATEQYSVGHHSVPWSASVVKLPSALVHV